MRAHETVDVMGDRPPVPGHTTEFYCHVKEVKAKKRRKKTDPQQYVITKIPWADINHSELMGLCQYNLGTDIRSRVELCRVLGRTTPRDTMIEMIVSGIIPGGMLTNPVHKQRDAIITWLEENWEYCYPQVLCEMECWDCTDVCVMNCYLDNANLYRER